MCLVNCNIVGVENKEVKRNSSLLFEERVIFRFSLKLFLLISGLSL